MRAGDRILAALCVIVGASGMACAPKQPPATSPGAEGSATSPRAEGSAPSDARKGAEAGQAEEGSQADTPPSNASQVPSDEEPGRPAASGEAPGLTPDPTVDEAVPDAQLMDAEAQRSVEALDEAARREFLEMFGSDPLGLALHPDNARYELPLEMNEKVERWIEYFQARIPERFTTYLERLVRYGPMIRGRLRAASLPEDLIYLALIESGLNPRAYSRARAVGIWQFIRGTGRMYGLKVDYWVDERRDPFKSTDAAVAHLSDLYEEFGSWYLAAAAYNAGAGRVRRALASTGGEDYWDLTRGRSLRPETRSYVPKMIAAAIIAKNPERYGFRDIVPQLPLAFELAEVPDATSMDVIAEAAGTEEAIIRELNPQYLRYVTPPKRRATIRVPPGTAQAFRVSYAKIPADKRVTWLIHVVTRGQTLGQIARRYGTSVAGIRAANNNVNPRRLQIGQKLIVPRSGKPTRVASASGNSGTRAASAPSTITVRRGDTLWSIARRYAVSTRDLMRWNSLNSTTIHPGDRLTVRR